MGARWILALADGMAPFLGASSSFVRVCVLLRKTRRRRLLVNYEGVCDDFVNLEMTCRLSLSGVLIGIGRVCAFIEVIICAYI